MVQEVWPGHLLFIFGITQGICKLQTEYYHREKWSFPPEPVAKQGKDVLFVLNTSGETLCIGEGIERISQFSVEEWLKLPQHKKYTAESLASAESHFRASYRYAVEGGSKSLENYSNLLTVFLIRKDGSLREVEIHYGFWLQNKEVQGIIGHLRDVTELKRFVALGDPPRPAYNSFSELLQEGLLLLDHALMVQYANPSAAEILGKTRQWLEGKHVSEVLFEGKKDAPLYKKITDGKLCRRETLNINHPEGYACWLQLNMNPYLPFGLDETQWLVSFTEVTTLVSQKQALDQANQAKDRLFSLISHDLRSPIQQSIQVLEMLQSRQLSKEEFHEIAAQVHSQIKHSRQLIENLLEWSKTQWSNGIPNFQRYFVHEIWNELHDWIAPQAQEKQLSLSFDFPETLEIFTDKDMLCTVLRNIFGNAIKYSRPGGSLFYHCRLGKKGMVMTCRDEGLGMNLDLLDKIKKATTPMYSNAGTLREKGSGIGLLLCNQYIQRLHGSLNIDSSLGLGTTVYLILPLKVPTDLISTPE